MEGDGSDSPVSGAQVRPPRAWKAARRGPCVSLPSAPRWEGATSSEKRRLPCGGPASSLPSPPWLPQPGAPPFYPSEGRTPGHLGPQEGAAGIRLSLI